MIKKGRTKKKFRKNELFKDYSVKGSTSPVAE